MGGVGGHADKVAFALEPWALLDAVLSLFGRPESEAVVVLCNEHCILCACGFRGSHPLVGVYLRGVEDGGIGGAIAPLAAEEGVWGEGGDDPDFEVLPLELSWARHDVGEALGDG